MPKEINLQPLILKMQKRENVYMFIGLIKLHMNLLCLSFEQSTIIKVEFERLACLQDECFNPF